MKLVDLGENEAFFRVIVPRFASTPTSGAGAAKQGGRFNRPGEEALYLARTAETAVHEYQQLEPLLAPGMLVTFLVSGVQIVDFSAGFDAEHWDPLWSEYGCDWRQLAYVAEFEPPTWQLADMSREAGAAGILFPSTIVTGGINLVLFDSSAMPAKSLRVHDPARDLPRDDRSWAPGGR